MLDEPTESTSLEQARAFHKSIEEHFSEVEDYRRKKSIRHKLSHILFIAICGITSGCNNLKAVVEYAQTKKAWFQSILDLSDGIPSYPTFWLFFALLNPEVLSKCFTEWVQAMAYYNKGRLIALDGKAQRGTSSSNSANSFIHIVSAWASENGLTLGQYKVDEKSNEITAIPKILDIIDVKDSIVTIDAMGTQKAVANKIIANEGEYILALKGNHSQLHDEVINFFDQALEYGDEGTEYHKYEECNVGHGRTEVRRVFSTEKIDFLQNGAQWQSLKSIVCVEAIRAIKGKVSQERRYYISSLITAPKDFAGCIRSHWGIESTHWILDVAFREDSQKAKAAHLPENLSLLRRISLNFLKQDKTVKAGIEIKRQKAGWDNEYLLRVLGVKSFS